MKNHMYSILALGLVAIMLILPLSVSSQYADPSGFVPPDSPAATVTANAVVRAWPSNDTESVGVIPARSIVPVTGRTADSAWWRIPYPTGPDGNGWPFGRSLSLSEIHAALKDVGNIDYIRDVRLHPVIDGIRQAATDIITIPADSLACSYQHEIIITDQ